MADQAELARQVVATLTSRGETICTCESLTAGLLGATIAGVSGASAVLQGGLITYSAELKHKLAGVSMSTIETHGVISRQCAEEMAEGARARCNSTWAISLTGVAGPTQQDGHPVGEVWFAIAGPEGLACSGLVEPDGPGVGEVSLSTLDRNALRHRCVTYALRSFLDVLAQQS